MTQNILFMGAGNMAGSIIGGLIHAGVDANTIHVFDINTDTVQALNKQYGIQVCADVVEVIASIDTVLLAVKPQHIRAVCESLAESFKSQSISAPPLIVSIAAGIRIQAIIKWFAIDVPVIRAMPNTPALVNCGASGLYANQWVQEAQKRAANEILAATGIVIWVNSETQLDTVTALSGSGPAYFFRIMESLTKSAIELGLEPETARQLTLQTALGAATMASQSELELSELRRRVTSPGGTTEQGLRVLEEQSIDILMKQVLQAAEQRSVELADQLELREGES